MKLAVVGSRTFNDYEILWDFIDLFQLDKQPGHGLPSKGELISGGAKGADSLAEKYSNEKKFPHIPITVFKPDWDKYGKSAGFKRNQQIVDACDMVLAFWDGKSRGTQDTISRAKKAKKPTFIVYF